ncbi:MAG: ligand-binding sensor domain-containing protein [Ignavibacteria bacterium]
MSAYHRIKATYFILILSFFSISCAEQIPDSIPVIVTKIHQDSISLKAETLPEFKVDVHDKESQENQISGVVRTVFQDSKGNIWFGTQNGLCRYDKSGLVYFDLKNSDSQSVTVHVILEDKTGNIWIGYGGGIAKYDGTYFTVFHQKNILTRSGLWSMTMDKKGILWIGTTQGVYTFDGKALSPFEIPEGKINSSMGVSTTKMIHSIIEDSKGKMWFATNGGAYIYDGKTLTNISEKDGLQSGFVNQIIEGADGNYWISTSTGLYQYNGNSLINKTENLLNLNDGVSSILEDKNGTLWFKSNKRDIYSYNGKVFTKIRIKEDDFSPFPFQIYQDKQDRLWFVGFKGAYRLENNTFINVTRNGPW